VEGAQASDNVSMTIIANDVAVAMSLFVFSFSAAATNLAGTVRDVCGPVLPGTSVSAANGSGAAARAVVDAEGHYSFSALSPGQWTIAFALPGFQTLQQDIRLRARENFRAS
jgi:hypothetical protein